MVNVGVKNGMKESLLDEIAPYSSLHWASLCKGLLLCLHHTRLRAKYYLIICRYMGTWIELYEMAKKAI